MTPDPAIATAADYADALITARRAKNVLVLILLLIVLLQLTLFILVRLGYVHLSSTEVEPATQSLSALGPQNSSWGIDRLHYLIDGSVFIGVALSIVLAMVVLLIVKVMLVGRLIGVGRLTSAYIWSIVLIVMLFPWQAFLANSSFTNPDFKIPGVLYNWTEFLADARFGDGKPLGWARFVLWPAVAAILLLVVQIKSNRGLKQALGDADATEMN
jgi:hypothetical protein